MAYVFRYTNSICLELLVNFATITNGGAFRDNELELHSTDYHHCVCFVSMDVRCYVHDMRSSMHVIDLIIVYTYHKSRTMHAMDDEL